jgi:predicted RNase H-like HicB family nuclease
LLPNLITEADTLDEVIPNVADALEALIEGYEDLTYPFHSPTRFELGRIQTRLTAASA